MYLGPYVGALSTAIPQIIVVAPDETFSNPSKTSLIAKSGSVLLAAGHVPARLGFGKPILTIYSLAARHFEIAVSLLPYFSNHAIVPYSLSGSGKAAL